MTAKFPTENESKYCLSGIDSHSISPHVVYITLRKVEYRVK